MTPDRFKTIRQQLGLSLYELGLAVGYQGTRQNVKNQIHRFETGAREIGPMLARLMLMYERHGIPKEFMTND